MKKVILLENSSKMIDCNHGGCGQGVHTSGGRYVCPHNNLIVLRPDLAAQWDHERNTKDPRMITLGTNLKVWWICPINSCGCHRWEASVSNRVNGYGCPYCVNQKICIHSSIQTLYPEVAKHQTCLAFDCYSNQKMGL